MLDFDFGHREFIAFGQRLPVLVNFLHFFHDFFSREFFFLLYDQHLIFLRFGFQTDDEVVSVLVLVNQHLFFLFLRFALEPPDLAAVEHDFTLLKGKMEHQLLEKVGESYDPRII